MSYFLTLYVPLEFSPKFPEISKKAKPEIREEPKVSSESDEGEVAEPVELVQETKQQMWDIPRSGLKLL